MNLKKYMQPVLINIQTLRTLRGFNDWWHIIHDTTEDRFTDVLKLQINW